MSGRKKSIINIIINIIINESRWVNRRLSFKVNDKDKDIYKIIREKFERMKKDIGKNPTRSDGGFQDYFNRKHRK